MTTNAKSRSKGGLGVKRLKDVDSAGQCLVFNTFFKIFPLLAILGLVGGGTIGLLVAAAVSVLAAFLCVGKTGTPFSFTVLS
jgi:hypothetical protein